jgi:thiamine biosynthesis lipoprotein ApbE
MSLGFLSYLCGGLQKSRKHVVITAFMVLGLDSAKAICSAHPELDAYFIYSDKDGKLQTYSTEGMKKYMRN